MGQARSKNVLRQALRLESLERREVFTFSALPYVIPFDPPDPLTQYISSRFYAPGGPSLDYDSELSRAEFDSKLESLVGKYWEGVLGKRANEIQPINNYYWPDFMFTQSSFISTGQNRLVADSTVSGAPVTRSITNNLEQGIDEGDSSETTNDGFLYTVVGNSVHVVDLRIPELPVTKNLFSVGNWFGMQLFVVGDTLITVGIATDQLTVRSSDFQTSVQQTEVKVYDITDRMEPCLKSTTKVDGANRIARFADGQLTLVQSNNSVLPLPELVTDDKGVERYQTLDQYIAAKRDAIVAALLPNYSQCTDSETEGPSLDGGQWDDLTFANDALSRSSSIWRFELEDNALTLLDSETLAGLNAENAYQGREAVYLFANAYPGGVGYVYKFGASSDGEFSADGVASVKGTINSGIYLSEYNGVLRVVSDRLYTAEVPIEIGPLLLAPVPVTQTVWKGEANITTIGDTADGWKVLGTLEDIGDGQGLLAVSFVGDRAVITTGTPERFDPLHGIDLSDPAKPVELSDLPIPGFTTYLKQVDETHWIGLGFEQTVATRSNHLQVSLYNVADWANPVVVDRWVSQDINGGANWDPHSISYDPETGLLVASGNQNWMFGIGVIMPVMQIDVDAEDPLKELGLPVGIDGTVRGFTLDDVYVAIGNLTVKTYDIDDLSKPIGSAFLANYDRFHYLSEWVVPGVSKIWSLNADWQGEPFVITDVQSQGVVKIKIHDDQSLELSSEEATVGGSQEFTITIRFASGDVRTFKGIVYSYLPEPVVPLPLGRASILYTLTDDAGNVVRDAGKGDEVWVTVSVQDDRAQGFGVFAGYVDVAFESQNLTVIGDIEYRDLTNGKGGTISSDGIKGLGGFGGAEFPGKIASEIGRFKIRIEDNEPILMRFNPARGIGNETLLYNSSSAVEPGNISVALWAPRTERLAATLSSEYQKQDINGDGVISAVDVLQVVNYINDRADAAAESASTLSSVNRLTVNDTLVSAFDISGDGAVSALDVLQIVNTINARYDAGVSGEGPSPSAAAVDQVFAVDAVDLDSDQFLVNKSSSRADKKIR